MLHQTRVSTLNLQKVSEEEENDLMHNFCHPNLDTNNVALHLLERLGGVRVHCHSSATIRYLGLIDFVKDVPNT